MVIARVLEIFSSACAVCGIFYSFLCAWNGRKAAQQRSDLKASAGLTGAPPPVSILKPLRGADPEMLENLRGHCRLDYPLYQILFGLHDPEDPALPLLEGLKAEFPQRDIRVFVLPTILGANVKVSNLAQLLGHAKYEHLVVNDSDIRVNPDYLQRVMAPFADARVGLVTCLYRAVAGKTIWSRLEALGISTDFCAGVLMANVLEREVRFGLGSTLAFRRGDLLQAGGFEAVLEYLADDYELGARIAQGGKRVQIADAVVETYLPAYSWRDFVRHQVRWARGIRDSRPWGYLGLCVTYAVPWALVALVLSGGAKWSWLLLAIALAARFSAALTVGGKVLGDGQVYKFWWLIPVRDCIALGLWAWAYTGRSVHWRGEEFLLRKGKLIASSDRKQAVAT